MRNTFKAYERLKREQHIDTLFRTGKAYSVFPLKLIYLIREREEGECAPVRMGVSIPKKRVKRAVERNLLKRRIREVWRLHKHELYELIPPGAQLHLFFVYTSPEISSYSIIEQAALKGLGRLKKTLTHE